MTTTLVGEAQQCVLPSVSPHKILFDFFALCGGFCTGRGISGVESTTSSKRASERARRNSTSSRRSTRACGAGTSL